jgi:outer membrane putative beta-barrel porin/alpha-amylase
MPRRTCSLWRLSSFSGNECRIKLWSAGIGIGLLLATGAAHAGPPFVTDDPEPPAPGGWEINVPFILERTPGQTDMNTPLFDLNYGLPDIQLKLEFPIEIVNEDNNSTQAGAGDSLIGVKWRFFNNEPSQFQLGTYPQVLVPTGNHSRALGKGRVAFVLPFLAQKSWEKWTLYGNIGYWWQGAHEARNYFYTGAVLEREINERLELGVEVFGNSPKERGGRSELAFNVGGTWKLSKHLNLLFTAGRDIVGDTHAMAYIGLQLLTK